jgi:DNA-binding NarL/FixJ family response regulator
MWVRCNVLSVSHDEGPEEVRMARASAPIVVASTLVLDGDEHVLVSYPATEPPGWALLTSAEREVAVALLDGWSNARIARARSVSVRTVANQIASIYRKLAVRSRAELAALRAR